MRAWQRRPARQRGRGLEGSGHGGHGGHGGHCQPGTWAKLGNNAYSRSRHATGTGLAAYEPDAYDPFGKRREPYGAYDGTHRLVGDYAGGTPYATGTDRGFTGHEHLDDVGVIHMNVRLFDPLIGRFMQADPVVGDPFDLQSYNGYSYVNNRPLVFADPTGKCPICIYFAAVIVARATGIIDQQTFRQLIALGVAWYLGPAAGANLAASGGAYAAAVAPAAQAAISGFASGVISSGNLKGGVQGAFSAVLFYGAGQAATGFGDAAAASGGNTAMWSAGGIGRAALHAGAGCIVAVAGNGDCGRGAMTAGVGKLLTGNLVGPANSDGERIGGMIASAVIGGTVSVLGGGKFANGAQMGAYQYLFNQTVAENRANGLRFERATMEELASRGITNVMEKVGVTLEVEGRKIYAIADYVYRVGDTIVVGEIKYGSNAAFTPNQEKVYTAIVNGAKVGFSPRGAEFLGVGDGRLVRVAFQLVTSVSNMATEYAALRWGIRGAGVALTVLAAPAVMAGQDLLEPHGNAGPCTGVFYDQKGNACPR